MCSGLTRRRFRKPAEGAFGDIVTPAVSRLHASRAQIGLQRLHLRWRELLRQQALGLRQTQRVGNRAAHGVRRAASATRCLSTTGDCLCHPRSCAGGLRLPTCRWVLLRDRSTSDHGREGSHDVVGVGGSLVCPPLWVLVQRGAALLSRMERTRYPAASPPPSIFWAAGLDALSDTRIGLLG